MTMEPKTGPTNAAVRSACAVLSLNNIECSHLRSGRLTKPDGTIFQFTKPREPPMIFAKRTYLIAGIYGLIVLLPQYFLESRFGRDFPPAITHAEFYYGFIGVAVAWQVAFLMIARDPLRYRGMMIPAIVEKGTFGIAVMILFVSRGVSAAMLAGGLIDLLLGALFVVALVRTAPSSQPRINSNSTVHEP
jgi:hypothetical protein